MNGKNLCRYCGKHNTDCELSMKDANDMLEAVRNNDLNRLSKLLIQGGKSPNIHHSDFSFTALHEAVREGRTDIVKYLLTLSDINIEQRDSCYRTALLLSVQLRNPKIAKMLIKKGANLKVLDCAGNTILHRAVSTNSPETVRFILSKGFDVNLTNNDGRTPLHLAVYENDFELVSMLLYHNADTDIIDVNGFTPFMTALIKNCNENIQRELFKYEYDYNRETEYCNILSLAVWFGSPLIIDLIKNGADVNYYCDDMNESILAKVLEICDPEIFFYVFPLTNLSILTECGECILTSFLRCNYNYNKKDWLKALFLILESDLLSEFIDNYYALTDNSGSLFRSFAKEFERRNISEDEFVKFIEICLCSGADVMFYDIETVFRVYSNNKAIPHLLNMKIINLPDFGYSLPYIFCRFDKNFATVLSKYCSYKFNNCANFRKSSVPSLLELSRNEVIIAICTKFDINSSHCYYYILRRLNLPKIFYDFLTFRRLIE